jgi:hypothetical protein
MASGSVSRIVAGRMNDSKCAANDESRNGLSGEQDVQRLRNIADARAQIGCAPPVNYDAQLGSRGDDRAVGVDDVRNLFHAFEQLF